MSNMLITIRENTDGCAEHYRRATAFNLFSMLLQEYSIIIDHGISVLGHGREVVDDLNAIEKRFILQLMSTVQLPSGKRYHKQMVIYTGTCTSNGSFSREFQKYLSTAALKHGVIYQGKNKNRQVNEIGKKGSIMFRMMLMPLTKV